MEIVVPCEHLRVARVGSFSKPRLSNLKIAGMLKLGYCICIFLEFLASSFLEIEASSFEVRSLLQIEVSSFEVSPLDENIAF